MRWLLLGGLLEEISPAQAWNGTGSRHNGEEMGWDPLITRRCPATKTPQVGVVEAVLMSLHHSVGIYVGLGW